MKKIGINRSFALGDVLLTTGIIKKLKKDNPDCLIEVATKIPSIFRNNPYVSRVVTNKSELHVDEIYDLDLAYEKKPKQSIISAYAEEVFGKNFTEEELIPELFSTENDKVSLLKHIDLNVFKNTVIVVHGSKSWKARTWPEDKWKDVIINLLRQGITVITIGRNLDLNVVGEGLINLNNKLSIFEIRELIKLADCFVGLDSGMFHIASTTQTPTVGLFTCVNPEYRIAKRNAKTLAIVPKGECKFCLHDAEPPVTFIDCKRGDYNCIKTLEVEDVLNSINQLIKIKLNKGKNTMTTYSKDFSKLDAVIGSKTLLTVDKVWVIYKHLLATDHLTGSMAELGVYKGGSAKLMSILSQGRKLYLFDTFGGMPEDDILIEGHKKNDFNDTDLLSVKNFVGENEITFFKQGFFPDTATGLENEMFSFVHLDADIYQSTLEGLKFFYPRLQSSGRIVLDDHMWKRCPGVEQAVNEYFVPRHNEVYMIKEAKYSLTIIKK